MSQGDRELQGTEERSALKFPIPVGLSSPTSNLTVTCWKTSFAAVAQFAPVAPACDDDWREFSSGESYTGQYHWAEALARFATPRSDSCSLSSRVSVVAQSMQGSVIDIPYSSLLKSFGMDWLPAFK
jgi:hypothetical protein